MKSFVSQPIIFGIFLCALLVFCVYPFLTLFQRVLFPQAGFDPQYLVAVLQSPVTLKAFANTFIICLAVTLFSIVLAIPLAWLVTRTDLPGASQFRSWFCLPYAIPPYIGAIAWVYLANPSTGLLNKVLGHSFFNIYSFCGLIWVETIFFYTLVLLVVLAAMDRMDSSLEEAARISGASPGQTFFQITLPLLKPAIFSGGVLVALASAASFGVPALIGTPARIYLLTTQIYTFQKMGSMGGLLKAGALSLILFALAIAFLAFNKFMLATNQYQTVNGKAARPSLIPLQRYRWPVVGVLICFLVVVFILPLTGISITAFSRVQGHLAWDNFSTDNLFNVLLATEETDRALMNSFYLATIAATLATGAGLLMAYIQCKTRWPGRGWLEVVASLPYSTPGTVVALALILAFSQGVFGLGPSLYNTMAMLWLAYFIKYLSFGVKTINSGFLQIDNVLAEAARVAGADWLATMRTIWVPLLKPALIASWFLIFMPAFSELTMTIMLTGPGIETVGTLLFQLQEYADVGGGGAAVLALLIVGFVLVINFVVKKLSQGQYGL